ncbi:hypothetical protein APE_0275a [Aeropyrum pernix K1]|uniref:DUF2283 domain-containing protein n=1 Tax=Aeropyrum pernix (strain ATCC 700893 / DSM 11879 / JCM 9820 / NBRC 100138 / K1) TaxID=272557 RepID=Q05E84_AERPE|nr:DUF2283 domain-containing protein [Aeropyrum pernix]BAF34717.1 hypothetical protein APE_0275a [Aeropyrum pernix K1]
MPSEIRLKYDRSSDALYIRVKESRIVDSEEIAPGIIVDYDEHGEIVGIEILGFSKKKIDLHRLVTEGPEAMVLEA